MRSAGESRSCASRSEAASSADGRKVTTGGARNTSRNAPSICAASTTGGNMRSSRATNSAKPSPEASTSQLTGGRAPRKRAARPFELPEAHETSREREAALEDVEEAEPVLPVIDRNARGRARVCGVPNVVHELYAVRRDIRRERARRSLERCPQEGREARLLLHEPRRRATHARTSRAFPTSCTSSANDGIRASHSMSVGKGPPRFHAWR